MHGLSAHTEGSTVQAHIYKWFILYRIDTIHNLFCNFDIKPHGILLKVGIFSLYHVMSDLPKRLSTEPTKRKESIYVYWKHINDKSLSSSLITSKIFSERFCWFSTLKIDFENQIFEEDVDNFGRSDNNLI